VNGLVRESDKIVRAEAFVAANPTTTTKCDTHQQPPLVSEHAVRHIEFVKWRRRVDREHPSPWDELHQPTPRRDDPQGVFKA